MRFLIRVEPGSSSGGGADAAVVSVSCAALGPTWTVPARTIRLTDDGRNGLMPVPDVPPDASAPHAALCAGDAAAFEEALGHYRARRPHGADTFGRYLFDVMVGSTWWDKIREGRGPGELVELALSWRSSEALRPFDRLPWELMHDGTRPLVATYDPRVAVTRVVESELTAPPRTSPAQLDLPVRVLFVLGAPADDPRIRAATEILGLLKSLAQPDRVQPLVLESATPHVVRANVQTFRPHVVHFLCHGDLREGHGFLELQPDEAGASGDCASSRLLDMLRPNGQPPPTVVVLGACRSAEVGDFPAGAAPGPSDLKALPGQPVVLGSLAAELVAGGVPIVVGMGGRVADIAARLFTRRLESSLLEGRPLVAATADARLAPFVHPDTGGAKSLVDVASVDWAYPTLFMHASVDATYVPTPARDIDTGPRELADWVKSVSVTPKTQPVFCGRQAFVDAFDDLFDGRRGVLVAYTRPKRDDTQGARFGKSRLMEQLAFRALRSGHLPVAWFKQRSGAPRALVDVLEELRKALRSAYDQIGAAVPAHRLVASLVAALREPASTSGTAAAVVAATQALSAARAEAATPDMQRRVRELGNLVAELQDAGLSGRAAVLALRLDLWELATAFRGTLGAIAAREQAAARPAPAWTAGAAPRVTLLLDDFDVLDRGFVDAVLELASQHGLGTSDAAIPLVLLCTIDDTPGALLLLPAVENPKPSYHALQLGAFGTSEEQLVYQRVLLHPFNDTLIDDDALGVSSKMPFAPAGRADPQTARFCEQTFSRQLKGRPDLLGTESLYLAASVALDKKYLVKANDDAVLTHLERKP